MLSVAQASELIAAHIPRLGTTHASLRDLTHRVLAEAISMERDQPPFDRVAMDGIAVNSQSSARRFRITGTQAAGAAPLTLASHDTCIEVMTGAQLPAGADCVIPVEQVQLNEGYATLAEQALLVAWQHIHRRGQDARAGQRVIAVGTRLTATEVAVIASAGKPNAQVSCMPRIAMVSTGDELVEPGLPIEPWQIRRSNNYAVHAALTRHGFTQLHDQHIRDDLDSLRAGLATLLNDHDVLILSGGISMGKFDYVPRILDELKVTRVFQQVAQRPGKPMWFGTRSDGKAVFALPGNPVSTIIGLHRYVLPGLLIMMGAIPRQELIALAAPAQALAALTVFKPVSLSTDQAGLTRATPRPTGGSGDFMSLLGTDGFVELPKSDTPISSHTVLPLYRW